MYVVSEIYYCVFMTVVDICWLIVKKELKCMKLKM